MTDSPNIESCSLSELSLRLKGVIRDTFSSPVWVRAEICEVHENANGNCYLELIEKENDKIIARQKAVIFSFTYRLLKPYFEENTGIALSPGVSILIACIYDFHEIYGLSLQIKDIEPSYTIGEAAKRKMEILQRLTDDGVADMNKQLIISTIPNRIAIISSATAAGYGDFVDQLSHNAFHYQFYYHLFPAVMQGDSTERSIIQALGKIYEHIDLFDVVVIIRGGGATAELTAFDNYAIAAHCAQFPLPIITGIGHQRDNSVLDAVAYKNVKTPTAVADFLINIINQTEENLNETAHRLIDTVQNLLLTSHQNIREQELRLVHTIRFFSNHQHELLQTQLILLKNACQKRIMTENHHLNTFQNTIYLLNPENLLKKGYTLTLKNGHIVTSKTLLKQGDTIETVFQDGTVHSCINNCN